MNISTFKLLRGIDTIKVKGKNYIIEIRNPKHSPYICEIKIITTIPEYYGGITNEDGVLYRSTYGLVMNNNIPYDDYVDKIEDMVKSGLYINIPDNMEERDRNKVRKEFESFKKMLVNVN